LTVNKKTKVLILTIFLSLLIILIPNSLILTTSELDNWQAQPMHISQLAESAPVSGYSPAQIKSAYNLPQTGGTGKTIAIVTAYHTPSILEDLNVFSREYGLPSMKDSNFEIHKMAEDIEVVPDWSIEASLDVQWAHAIAPDAKILLVEALSNKRTDLLAAIDYARARPDVVSISLSWGGVEPSNPTFYNQRLVSEYGAVFFAASGDNGSGVLWPASSSKVVAVGGTSLRIGINGSVLSEYGWSGSGGGISSYEPIPLYQITFGIEGSKRTVPDVSYNANPAYGYAVYFNDTWHLVGGTSAGAPQWAAIHALGLSASNPNLYSKATLSYSSFFRDITVGSNGDFNATTGYDYVTGLGSPLTANFGSSLKVTPTFGASESPIILNGIGFNPGTSVNISYQNPVSTNWIQIASNLSVSPHSNFNFTLNSPDLLQNNPPYDSEALFDNITFRAIDNSDGVSIETVTQFREYRRGLAHIGSLASNGLFGNGTELDLINLLQNGQPIKIVGSWFNPGNLTVLWDGIFIQNSTINENGSLDFTFDIPRLQYGVHTLTLRDKNSNFCLILRNADQPKLPLLTPTPTSKPTPTNTPTPVPTTLPTPTPVPTTLPTPTPVPTTLPTPTPTHQSGRTSSPSTTPQPTINNKPTPSSLHSSIPTHDPSPSISDTPTNTTASSDFIVEAQTLISILAIVLLIIVLLAAVILRSKNSTGNRFSY
jgi:hypothetical protein